MTKNEIRHYWNYFCSLCKKLNNTKQYANHSTENNKFKYGDINSFEFQQIILLAAMEFENISKVICSDIDNNFDVEKSSIIDISETILGKYPHIGKTEIQTDYQILMPLEFWKVETNPLDSNKCVKGISWWKDYNELKHKNYWSFEKATLENAVTALASLYVLELYLMKSTLGDTDIIAENRCEYFYNSYSGVLLWGKGVDLPDFK